MSKYNKILGSIMGAAVGDAMGAATETRSAERIKEDFGGYVDKIITPPSDCFARGYDAGTVTDDFSLAYFTAKELVASKGNVDAEAAKRALFTWASYPQFFRFAGPTTEAAIKKLPKAEKEALAAKWAADNRITIRMATPADGAAVAELYNWYVLHGTQTFQYRLSTAEEYAANIAGVLEKAPFLVAITPDGRLQGFACAHPWHSREAYAWNVEATIYCAPDCVGQGLGKRLYTALLELLRMQGYYNAFAIVTGENKASHEFHKRMGFTKSFVEKHSGYKFGRWLDVVYWQYPLRTGDAPPEPVRYRLTEAEMVSILEKVNL